MVAAHAATQLAGPSIETLETLLDVTYTWGYQETRQKLRDLYDKAVRAQWISDDVLPWQTNVDLEQPMGPEQLMPLFGSDIYNRMTEKERGSSTSRRSRGRCRSSSTASRARCSRPRSSSTRCRTSTASCTRRSQVVDEARHVDVYNRYVHTKIGFSYPCNPHLKTLLDMILKDSRWDMKFLGMQIMVEGLALAAFGMIRNNTQEPLLKRADRVRDGRRGAPRRVRRAVAARLLPGAAGEREARARGLRLRGRAPDARPVPVPGSVGEARACRRRSAWRSRSTTRAR